MRCIIDGHCDTLTKALDEASNLQNEKYCFNLVNVYNRVPYIQMMATFINPKCLISKSSGFERALTILDKFEKEKEKNKNIVQILNRKDFDEVLNKNKIGIILTIENGSAISGKIENVEELYKRGVRVMSVTWNEDNDLGCGALTKNDNGLSKLGENYIKKLEEKGIIIDVSHSSSKTFWDIVKYTNNTIVATHSCSKAICNHPRNLDDEQIKEIARREGIIGICFASHFLNETGISNSKDIVKHIKYIKNLVGIDYIGLGSDFDGVDFNKMPIDIRGVKDIDILEKEMKKASFTDKEINKVMGENWIRVLNKLLPI